MLAKIQYRFKHLQNQENKQFITNQVSNALE